MKSFLFITSTNLASNPRLVKELQLAMETGNLATVIQFRVGNWSDEVSAELEKTFTTVRFINLSATRKPFLPWLTASFFEKMFSLSHPLFLSLKNLSVATGKRSWTIYRALKQEADTYDWVIAHNPAAFYPAYYISKKRHTRLGLDIEDYHPGETNSKRSQHLMKKLLQHLLPAADYCSFAAPLIAKEIQKDIPEMSNRQIVILNGFPATEFIVPSDQKEGKMKLVWFSQNINRGRGLEQMIAAMDSLYMHAELHLIGNPDFRFIEEEISGKKGIYIHKPVPQRELHLLLSMFDIGLALDPPLNRNRELAITNKIIAYAQAGLYIVGFHSQGQSEFLAQHHLYHTIVENNKESLIDTFLKLNKNEILQYKKKQYELGKQLDWSMQKNKLAEIWSQA